MTQTRRRLPKWIKAKAPSGDTYHELKKLMREQRLATVCEEARCPNVAECWNSGTLTVMIMGEVCTRGCRFCSVKTGKYGPPLDPDEPRRLADSLATLNLNYVVFTSVDRDDVVDLGADHFRQAILEVRRACPDMRVEVLTPDFQGKRDLVVHVASALPDVFAHNVETVERLHPIVRDHRATFKQTLNVLEWASEFCLTKSSIMVGHGETEAEVVDTMKALRGVGVSIVTLGQYLQPSPQQLPVQEFVTPEQFKRYQQIGEELGFAFVASDPLVRSSYKAAEVFAQSYLEKRDQAFTV